MPAENLEASMAIGIFGQYVPYAQLACGSIKKDEFDRDFNTLVGGICYHAARTANVAREYFLEKTSGFKQLAKIPGIIDMGYEWKMIPINSTPIKMFISACSTVRKGVTFTEVGSKLKGVFKPWHETSVWDETEESSYLSIALAKGAEIADWTMSVTETGVWLDKLGFPVARLVTTVTLNTLFNVASTVFLLQGAKTEAAKWFTGYVIDPITGDSRDFNGVDKIKSLIVCIIMASYAGLTAMAFAQMAGVVIANEAFLTFFCFGMATAGTIGSHLWEELVIRGV